MYYILFQRFFPNDFFPKLPRTSPQIRRPSTGPSKFFCFRKSWYSSKFFQNQQHFFSRTCDLLLQQRFFTLKDILYLQSFLHISWPV